MALPYTVLAVLGVLMLTLPRRYALVPLLIAVLHTTRASMVAIGPADFSILRLLIAIGLVRILMRGERPANPGHTVDKLMLAFGILMMLSSFGHSAEKENPFVMRLGVTLDYLGFYWLTRCFVGEWEDLRRLLVPLVVALILAGGLMMREKRTGAGSYGLLGGSGRVGVRDGKIRASGAFAHPILAGSAGAGLMPILLALWPRRKPLIAVGVGACLAMVLASSSSGPILAMLAGLGGLVIWHWRQHLRLIQWGAVAFVMLLQLGMSRPVWYITGYLNLVGGSTGWHRAALIDGALIHLPEWWLCGTDYTRHWMPTGVSWNESHTDITNQFILVGVQAGLAATLIFVAMLVAAFRQVGSYVKEYPDDAVPSDDRSAFSAWCLGANLVVHCTTFMSVAYFDLSWGLFCFCLAAVVGLARTPVDVAEGEAELMDDSSVAS
ncbi:MAG: hypothetical protein ACYDC1_18855, partial [Limisphaerales bacterium]